MTNTHQPRFQTQHYEGLRLLPMILIGAAALGAAFFVAGHSLAAGRFSTNPLLQSLLLGATASVFSWLTRRQADGSEQDDGNYDEDELPYRQLFERNLAVQLLIDPATGEIIDANPAAIQFYGYSREQLRSMRISEINTLSPEQVKAAMEHAQAQQVNHFQFQHKLASGEIRDVEVTSNPVEIDGHTLLYSIVHDVSSYRRAEEALSEGERRFRAIFDQTFQFIGVLEPDGTVIEANQIGLDFGGLRREDVIRRPLWEARWWKGAMPERIREAVAVAASGRLYRGELEMSGASGEAVAIEFSIKPVKDSTGKVVLLIPEGRDISDLKRVVRALRETNQTLEALVESSPLPIIALDRTGNVKMWNPAAEDTFGWAGNDVLGRGNPLITPENEAVFQDTADRVLDGISIHGLEVVYPRRNDTPIHVSLSSAPLRDSRGEIDGVMILAMDITERKQAAEALRQSEAELRALFEAMTDMIVVLDSEGRYLKVAPTSEPLLMLPAEQLVGKTLYDVFPTDEAERYHDYIQLALETRQPVKVEYSAKVSTGDAWFVATISPMLEDTVVWVARDITERKRSEAVQSALYRIADMTAAAEDMQEFYEAIHTVVGELMFARNFYIALHDKNNDLLTFPYFIDETEDNSAPQRPSEGLTGQVMLTGKPLWVTEVERAELIASGAVIQIGAPAVDWMGVPLKKGDETFGVLAVQSYSPEMRYTEQDLELLTYVSKHISAALERKQAAEALRQSEERYRKLIDTSPDAVTYTDINTRVLLANQQAAEMYGYSLEEYKRQSAFELIVPEDRDRAIANARKTLEEGRLTNIEYMMARKDGSRFPAELSAALIVDAEGKPQGFIGITRDITERKRIELGEREQRALAEALRDTAAALNSTLQLDELLDRILMLMDSVVPHDASAIILLEGDQIRIARWRATPAASLNQENLEDLTPRLTEAANLRLMLESRLPLVIPDTRQFPNWLDHPASNWIRSYIGAPILVKGDVVGFLNLDSHQANFFNEDHGRRLQAFADQVGLALQNAWLYESERKQLHLSQTLQEVGALMTSQLSLNEVLEHIFDLLGRVIRHDAVCLVLVDPTDRRLEAVAARGYPNLEIAQDFIRRMPLEEFEKRWGDQPVCVIPDTLKDPRWKPDESGELEITRSWIGAPLRVKGDLIGILNIDCFTPDAYDEHDGETAVAFANHAAVALHNAALYESERRQREIAEFISDTTAAVASSLDPGHVLLTLATRLREMSGFHTCTIYEWDRENNRIQTLSQHVRALWESTQTLDYALEEFPQTRAVLEAGKAVVVKCRDEDADPAELQWIRIKGFEWLLLLPIYQEGQIIGLAEIGSAAGEAVIDTAAIKRCQSILKKAESQLRDPLWLGNFDDLFDLAKRLAEASGGNWVGLSSWLRERNIVRTAVEYGDLTWLPDEGPNFTLAERPGVLRALQADQTVVIRQSDGDLDDSDRAHMNRWGLSMRVTQPLSVKGTVIGLVELDHIEADRQITPEELRLWRVVVDQAAVALENARLYARSQERNKQLAVLNEITRIGSATFDLNELLQSLADIAGQIIGGDNCYITLWDARARRVIPAAASGSYRGTYAEQPPTDANTHTMTRSVIEAGHPLAVEDLSSTSFMDRKFVERYPAKSMLGVPLHSENRALGGLLITFSETHHFTEEEMRWAEQAAELIALAIAKAQAYSELEERVEERTAQLRNVNQRLMMLTQLKDEFVANVSHELRTPITSIKLHHHLLKIKPDSFDTYMERLIRETERLEYIINDLLRLSEMDQGDMELNFIPTDLNTLAQLFITDRTLLAQERGLELTFEPAHSLPAVSADQMLIGQALSILLTNALNYTPRGGEISVTTRAEERDGQESVVLRVRDTGPGIPVEEQPNLFQRFFRGRVGKDSDAAGTGLGLAIAHEIIERHHGQIEVSSAGIPGKGAMFSIWLPVHHPGDEDQEEWQYESENHPSRA